MSDPNRHGATPLGGRAKRISLAKQWAGYVALERICPACGHANVERNHFCARCAADISQTEPTAASSELAGKELLRYRLASEERAARRARVQYAQGGTGLILVGAIFLLIGSWITTDVAWQLAVWSFGLILAIAGIWRVRTDPVALRNWGAILASALVFLIALFVNNSLANDASLPPPTPTSEPTLAAVATPAPASIADVPVFRGASDRTGIQPGPAPRTQPTLAWRFDTGGEIDGSPVIGGGRLFVTSKSGDLHALDASTGTHLWTFPLSDYVVRSTPAYADGVVYVGAGFSFFAIDAASGTERWRFAMGYAGQSAPLILDSAIIVASQEGWLYNLDPATGKAHWRVATEGFPFGAVTSDGSHVFVATDAGIVNAVSVENGRQFWRRQIDDAFFTSPVIADGLVIAVGRNAGTYAIDIATGRQVWSISSMGMQSVAVADRIVYHVANNGTLTALNLSDGASLWTVASGRAAASDPIVVDDLVIFGSGPNLTTVDRATGTIVWTFLAGDTITASPIVTGNAIFFGSTDGFLTRLSG
jgi:outer membrane protein assembly factor BamB